MLERQPGWVPEEAADEVVLNDVIEELMQQSRASSSSADAPQGAAACTSASGVSIGCACNRTQAESHVLASLFEWLGCCLGMCRTCKAFTTGQVGRGEEQDRNPPDSALLLVDVIMRMAFSTAILSALADCSIGSEPACCLPLWKQETVLGSGSAVVCCLQVHSASPSPVQSRCLHCSGEWRRRHARCMYSLVATTVYDTCI